MLGENVLHHMRGLGALVDGQAFLAGNPVGEDGARLQGDAGVTAEDEFGLDDFISVGEGGIDGAGIELALEGEIVAQLGMDDRRCRIERCQHVGNRLQLLIIDENALGCVLR